MARIPLITIIIRTLLAVLLSGVIGFERERKHRAAGFRTHILVCLGSMSIMLLSEYMFIQYNTNYGILLDPGRLGAQVVSGMGFLGAGAIIRSGVNIRGLTTAASLWVCAAIGLTVGSGFYSLAITMTVVLLIILYTFNKLPRKFLAGKKDSTVLIIEFVNKPKNLGHINLLLSKMDVKINHIEYMHDIAGQASDDIATMKLEMEFTDNNRYQEVYNGLINISGVVKVEKAW